mgnify:CR=1 FL=1
MSPNLDSTMISRFPLFIFPKDTTPSISDTTAGFEGLRASNNSVTLGRPPVISPALPAIVTVSKFAKPPPKPISPRLPAAASNSNAAVLASEVGALSADHLMEVSKEGISKLAKNDVVATLLPGTTFFLV